MEPSPTSHSIPRPQAHATTARGLFLAAALLSFALSVALYFSGDETEGIFVGLWVPSILALGAFLCPRSVDGAGREPAVRADEEERR
jgi:hypothetical protein